MRTLDFFVVDIPKRLNDTIRTQGGLELFVDTKFDEFSHRITEGEVVASPERYDIEVSSGDTLYFHHLVVVNDGQPLTGVENHYIVKCDKQFTLNNQAFAYKCKKTGGIHPLFGWTLLEAVDQEDEPASEIIEIVKIEEDPVRIGRVSFDCDELAELGVKKGDVVGFAKDMDYRIQIDDKEYYRVRAEDLLYVET